MAKIPGLPVAFVVIGGVLVWSGIENQQIGRASCRERV